MLPKFLTTKRLVNGPKNGVVLLGVAILTMLWLVVFVRHAENRSTELSQSQSLNETLSLLFEETIQRSIAEMDKALLYMRRKIERDYDTVGLQSVIASKDILSPLIVQVAIIDRLGVMRASSVGPQPAPPTDLSDREHFKVHLHRQDDFLFISKPLVGRASGKWSIQLTRRFTLKDGSFGGVLVASMNPGHFTKFYDEITKGGSKSITLIGTDGIVRASGGGQGLDRLALGTQIDIEQTLAHLNDKAVVTFPDFGADKAQKRITTLRKVRNQDLAVLVSTSEDEILAGTQTDLFWTSLVSLALSIIVVFVMQRSIKSQLQLILAQTALCRSERKAKKKAANLEITLDNMDQGILMVKSNGTIAIMNRQLCKLLDLPDEFLVQKPDFLGLLKFQESKEEFTETITVESTMQQLFPPSG
ncbi:MAG: cache domain-containing protein, partial [Hyphomicrobiaceae bacterium]